MVEWRSASCSNPSLLTKGWWNKPTVYLSNAQIKRKKWMKIEELIDLG